MSRLLPIDLLNARFSKAAFGGYRFEEVDATMERAGQALEELTAENDDLRTRVLRLQGDLDAMRAEERLVKEAIVSAQRAAELLRADAAREAELIREEARHHARAERSQAQKDAEALRDDVERLQTMRKRLLAEHRDLLQKSLRDLDELAPPTPPSKPVAPPAAIPVPETPPDPPYPTRLPPNARPLDPVIVEDETGERWVS